MQDNAISGLTSHDDAIDFLYASYGQSHSVYGEPVKAREGAHRHQSHIVDRFFPANKAARVLEVGCGDGLLVEVAQRSGYKNVVGIDASKSMIDLAHQRAAAGGIIGADILHFADAVTYIQSRKPGDFDLIVAIDVIEHLELHDVLRFFAAAYAVLSPGGRVVIQVPNGASPFHGRILHGDLTHYRAFTDKSLHQISKICGFQSVQVFESAPVPSGLKSSLRAFLWKLVRIPAVLSLAIETGQVRGHILTVNLVSVMTR